ncbi:MAG: CoA transferase, partial [Chloroflexi bacterium]|nr:CoA transferase [Chloroflexota bacterium]
VLERDDVFYEPQMVENNMFIRVDHAVKGPVLSFAPPFTLSDADAVTHRPPPLLGEHTVEVLTELDLTQEEIAELQTKGIV